MEESVTKNPKLEHRIILVSAVLGIAGFILLAERARTSVANTGAVTTASDAGTNAGGTTNPTTPAPLPTIELKFSEDSSNALQYLFQSGVSQSGGGGFSLGGLFSIGGGGGGTNSKTAHVQTGVTNQFSADTTITNADAATLTSIEDWLTNLAGTQDQRTQTNLAELGAGQNYLPANDTGGTTQVTQG